MCWDGSLLEVWVWQFSTLNSSSDFVLHAMVDQTQGTQVS